MTTHIWRMSWEPPSQALACAEAAALGVGRQVAPGLFLGTTPYAAGCAGYGVGGGQVLAAGEPGTLRLPAREPVHVARGPWKPSTKAGGSCARGYRRPRSGPRGSAHYLYCTERVWYLVRAIPEPSFVAPVVLHRHSASLPAKMARAIINLIARPGDRVIDPFCGAGVLLIEALRQGCRGYGCDLSERAVEQAEANVGALGLRAQLEVRDAFSLANVPRCDALVTDLPYGVLLAPPDLDALLELLPKLARRWAVVASVDLRDHGGDAAARIHTVIEVPKSRLVRYVCLGGERPPVGSP